MSFSKVIFEKLNILLALHSKYTRALTLMEKKGPPFIRADEPAIYRPLASGVGGK